MQPACRISEIELPSTTVVVALRAASFSKNDRSLEPSPMLGTPRWMSRRGRVGLAFSPTWQQGCVLTRCARLQQISSARKTSPLWPSAVAAVCH